MAIFLFNLSNHITESGDMVGHDSILDPVMIIMHQLRALGHQAEWSNTQLLVGSDAFNVVVECHASEAAIEDLAKARAQGARFLCIATEQPTPKGFNGGVVPGMAERQEMFVRAAKHFDGVFCLVPGAEAWFGQHAPAARLELGYAPSLERRVPNVAVDHDYGFFGSVTSRRLHMLNELNKRTGGHVRVVGTFPSQGDRDIEVSRCKVVVQIRPNDSSALVSSSRCNTALHLGRPVVAEPHQLSKPWDQVVRFTSTVDQFYNECGKARHHWRRMHQEQLKRFKDLFSPQRTVGAALAAVGLGRSMAA